MTTGTKAYYLFEVTHHDGVVVRVPVISVAEHDEARMKIVNEYDGGGGQPYSVKKWPLVTEFLPPDMVVVPLDQRNEVTCWSSLRINDYVFGIGNGTVRPEDQPKPVMVDVAKAVLRSCMFRDLTMQQIIDTVRAVHGARWFVSMRVKNAIEKLRRDGRLSVFMWHEGEGLWRSEPRRS